MNSRVNIQELNTIHKRLIFFNKDDFTGAEIRALIKKKCNISEALSYKYLKAMVERKLLQKLGNKFRPVIL